MTITHPHGHPALSRRLARIEQRGARHRAAGVVICFCLPALVAVGIAATAVLPSVTPDTTPVPGATAIEAVAP